MVPERMASLFGFNCFRLESFKELVSFRSLLIVSPVFVLTVKHWITLVVIVLFFGSLFFLFSKQKLRQDDTCELMFWRKLIALILIGPVIAVSIGQLLRWELNTANFDAPLRIALCAPIFLAVSFGWTNSNAKHPITFVWVKYSFPIGLIFTLIYKPSWTNNWGPHVITTYFVDPLSFGTLTLFFSLLAFTTLSFFWYQFGWGTRLISISAVLCGLYLSLQSGSRTGWLNLPFYFTLWAFVFSFPTYGRLKTLFILLLMTLIIGILVSVSPHFSGKVLSSFNEVISYHWDSENVEGSTSDRISIYRIAIFYFLKNPIIGWGETGWTALINSPEIIKFASFGARTIPKYGFHNEILTSAVRSGVFGLASSLALFFCPVFWAAKLARNSNNIATKQISFFIIITMSHMFFSGITTEVTNLVFLASFWALIIALFVGESMSLVARSAALAVTYRASIKRAF